MSPVATTVLPRISASRPAATVSVSALIDEPTACVLLPLLWLLLALEYPKPGGGSLLPRKGSASSIPTLAPWVAIWLTWWMPSSTLLLLLACARWLASCSMVSMSTSRPAARLVAPVEPMLLATSLMSPVPAAALPAWMSTLLPLRLLASTWLVLALCALWLCDWMVTMPGRPFLLL